MERFNKQFKFNDDSMTLQPDDVLLQSDGKTPLEEWLKVRLIYIQQMRASPTISSGLIGQTYQQSAIQIHQKSVADNTYEGYEWTEVGKASSSSSTDGKTPRTIVTGWRKLPPADVAEFVRFLDDETLSCIRNYDNITMESMEEHQQQLGDLEDDGGTISGGGSGFGMGSGTDSSGGSSSSDHGSSSGMDSPGIRWSSSMDASSLAVTPTVRMTPTPVVAHAEHKCATLTTMTTLKSEKTPATTEAESSTTTTESPGILEQVYTQVNRGLNWFTHRKNRTPVVVIVVSVLVLTYYMGKRSGRRQQKQKYMQQYLNSHSPVSIESPLASSSSSSSSFFAPQPPPSQPVATDMYGRPYSDGPHTLGRAFGSYMQPQQLVPSSPPAPPVPAYQPQAQPLEMDTPATAYPHASSRSRRSTPASLLDYHSPSARAPPPPPPAPAQPQQRSSSSYYSQPYRSTR